MSATPSPSTPTVESRHPGQNSRLYRFRQYTAAADDQALPVYAVVCVTGEETNSGAESGDMTDPQGPVRWMADHYQARGHDLFEQSSRNTVRLTPGAWL